MTIKVGPCGGDRGELKDMEHPDNITSIKKIRVAYNNNYIISIAITYMVNQCEKAIKWGGEGGTCKEFTLQTGEHITSLKGRCGKSDGDNWFGLRALKFETNLKSVGPYGNASAGSPFELPAIHGRIIAFHGRAGTRLDALGIHVQDAHQTGASTRTGF